MPMTVPMMRGGAKSLPAELKVGGNNPVRRMQAQSAGYGPRRVMSPYHRALSGFRGLGQDGTDVVPIDVGTLTPIDLTPTGTTTGGNISVYTDPVTGAISAVDANGNLITTTGQNTGSFTPVAIPTQYTGAPPAGYTGPTQVAANATPPAAPAGYQWASLLNSTGQTLAKVLAISQGGSSVTLPNGTQLVYGSAASSVAGSGSSLFTSSTALGGLSIGTLGLLAVGAFVLMSMGKK